MTVPKAGYKGDVYIGAQKIAAATWMHAGGERQMSPVDELGDEIITDVPLQIRGGIITITGHYKLDSDAGQQLLATKFAGGDQITDLKLYTDKDNNIYLTPDDTTTPASYATVTNCRNVGDDKSGIGTISITMLMSGVLKQVGDTTEVAVVTTGSIDVTYGAGDTCYATLIGELVCAGEETTVWPKVQFEYGKTISYGTTTALQEMDATPQMFDEETAHTLEIDTLYHFRAVAVLEDTSKKYGKDKSFTTPAA